MADRASLGMGPRLDIQQLQIEAQHRWLRPAEICEILRNYQMFQITSEPPTTPPSGSLFLFNRKVLRYFRKDGHNWRKKKDGKTVKEAHEKLKVGSIDVLHCYYAHGEENENFQRRSYWMLEPEMMHIVFVHYLEVKGNRSNIGGNRETDDMTSDSRMSGSLTAGSPTSHSAAPSGSTESMSPTSTLSSLCEDADSEDIHQASSRSHSVRQLPHMIKGPMMDTTNADLLSSYFPRPFSDEQEQASLPEAGYFPYAQGDRFQGSRDGACTLEGQNTSCTASWETILKHCAVGFDPQPSHVTLSSTQMSSTGNLLEQEHGVLGDHLLEKSISKKCGTSQSNQSNWLIPLEESMAHMPQWAISQSMGLEIGAGFDTGMLDQRCHPSNFGVAHELYAMSGEPNVVPEQENLSIQQCDEQSQCDLKYDAENPPEETLSYTSTPKRSLLKGEESLQKVDSFSRWITKELEEVDDLQMQSSSGISWSTIECGNVIDDSSLSPSLSQVQHFSIIDFSPKWAYTESETEVLIIGTFLKSYEEVANCNWSCMFGEVEVPSEVLGNGVLSCHAPPHKLGRVPFYVTCSNRLACSEVREFDYREGSIKKIDITDVYGGSTSKLLIHLRLERLLSLKTGSRSKSNHPLNGDMEKRNLIGKLILLKEEGYSQEGRTTEINLSQYEVKEQLLYKQVKQKLYSWLLHKVTEDGKGPSVLDEEGQGVLHLAAALGYDWAITPTVIAGVSINFRDVNGWTALHWAASCGREQTVAFLVSLGAAPGALTDPCLEYPLARTPADLASSNGHKGISGFLAELSLTNHLSTLTMDDSKDGGREAFEVNDVQTVSELTATPVIHSDVPDALLLKDSLNAVCKATQAADRIHQVFRMQSFQRRQLTQSNNDELDEHALSLLVSMTRKAVKGDGLAQAAAVCIQKKFRGWKKRKEFLIIRQRIVKIQAHVRGHQVRKQYRSIIWSVGILEKVILRWRRKGSGLRGFRPDALVKNSNHQNAPLKEDDYDFFKEGRKQTEERLQKALSRVKSMVQYPEARAQYSRLLNVVEGYREKKVGNMDLMNSEETADGVEDLINIDMLLDDDNFLDVAYDSPSLPQ